MFPDLHGKYILFDLLAGFFSFQPILEAFKEINALPEKISLVLIQLALTKERLVPTPPGYLFNQQYVNLSHLLKPELSTTGDKVWAQRVETRALLESPADL